MQLLFRYVLCERFEETFFHLLSFSFLEEDEFESFTEGTGQTSNSISSNSIQYHQNIEPTLHVKDLVSEEAVNASPESEAVSLVEMDIDSRIDAIVESCKSSGYIQNPVQILMCLQEKLITGRPLEILDSTS